MKIRKIELIKMPRMAAKTMAGMPFGNRKGILNGNTPLGRARLPPMPQIKMMAPTANCFGSNRLTFSANWWRWSTPCPRL